MMQAFTVCELFEKTFQALYRVKIVGGADEPLYEPAVNGSDFNTIYFRIRHWFVITVGKIAETATACNNKKLQWDADLGGSKTYTLVLAAYCLHFGAYAIRLYELVV